MTTISGKSKDNIYVCQLSDRNSSFNRKAVTKPEAEIEDN
jgi:hypothetical protein